MGEAGARDHGQTVSGCSPGCLELQGVSIREPVDVTIAGSLDFIIKALSDKYSIGVLGDPMSPAVENVGQWVGERRAVPQHD